MPRPLVRTEVIDEDLAALMQQQFGSATVAHRNLAVSLEAKRVSFYVFQRAFLGKPVEKRVVGAIQEAMLEWGGRIWALTKERRKALQEVG